jgi:hypothetical protein
VIFLEPAKSTDAKSRNLTAKLLALMAEYAEAQGVKKHPG